MLLYTAGNASGQASAERLREITEALWDAQTFYEKMGALMFGQAFVYGSREVVVRPFTVYEEGFRETPEEFATTYSISGTLLRCYDLLNDFMPGEEEAQEEAEGLNNEMYRLVLISDYAPEGNSQALEILTRSFNDLKKKCGRYLRTDPGSWRPYDRQDQTDEKQYQTAVYPGNAL